MAPGGLLERQDELARIDELLAAAQAGHGGLLLVTGPAGIGKTVLLAAARERAGRAGMRVLAGRGRELEGGFSFGVARQLFESLLAGSAVADREVLLAGAARRALIALGGEAGAAPPVPGSDALFAAVHGLYWLLVNAAGAGPVLVAVDDLHWADQASLRFVSYLAGRLAGLPAALVLSWRAGETGAVADRFARLEEVAAGSAVRPAALSMEGARAVLAGAFDAAPAERFAAACHTATGGNPFLLRELIQSLPADGIGPGEGAADRVAGLGPRSVARSVALRAAWLGPAAGELARAAAILGEEAQLRHAGALAGVPVADAAAAADALAGIGVFEPGTPLRFVHPIVRTAVYDDIPQADRGLRHAAAARLLGAEGADLERVCAHLLVCGPTGSAEVVERLQAAARGALARGAPESAGVYLRRALAETLDVSRRAALLDELGQAETLTRDPGAVQHLREALDLATDPVQRALIAHDLADLLILAGQWDAGAAAVQAAIAELATWDTQVRARARPIAVRLQTLWAGLAAYDPRLAGEFGQHLDELVAAARGHDAASRLLAALLAGVLATRCGEAGQARELLDHALDGGRLLTQVDSDSLVVSQALFGAVWLEQPTRAEALAGQLLTLSRSHGSVVGVAIGTCLRAAVRARRGDLLNAETDVRTAFEIGQEHSMAFGIVEALHWGSDALIERPELADLAALAAGIELGPDMMRTARGAMLREVRGRLAHARGDFCTARAELAAMASTYQALHMLNPSRSSWRSALALAMAGVDRAQAMRLADTELADARRLGSARPTGIALRTRGMLAGSEQGLNDLREATEVLAGTDARLEHARALTELGAAQRRANQRAAARMPLRAALDLAYRCGARRLAQRAETELRAAGARPRRAVLTGMEALTASERRTAELAAAGMSNPEIAQALFVTLNTVESHLRHAYQKLSISSRSQLPTALHSAAPETSILPGARQKTTMAL
jgi:DNA-binding CsgD family transcriptional regulator